MKRIDLIFCLVLLVIFISGCISGGTKIEDPASQRTLTPTSPAPITTPPQSPSILSTILEKGYQDISVHEVMRKIENKDDFILLDVRTPMEFEEGYIEGAILIPYMELERRHLELKAPKDKEIVVYCKAGVRSKKGAKKLVELGYTNVKNMDAGTDGWAAAGGEFVKPTTTPQHTTMPPLTETSPPPTTTWAPTTMPPTTTAPPAQYFEGEPNIVVPKDKETQFSIIPYDVVQIGDAMLYYTYDPGHCVGLATWEFGIFRKEEGNWLYENTVGYTEGAVYPDIPPTDWSQMIHDKTDALDNYDILVKYGTGGKLTVTSIPK